MSNARHFQINRIAAALLALGALPPVASAQVALVLPTTLAAGVPNTLAATDPATGGCAGNPSAQRYLFSVRDGAGKQVFFRDYRAANQAAWAPMDQGTYVITAKTACFTEATATTKVGRTFATAANKTVTVVARDQAPGLPGATQTTGEAAVFDTEHPLVRLVQTKACPSGAGSAGLRVEFAPAAGATPFADPAGITSTPAKACNPKTRSYFLLAGMRPDSHYRARLVLAATATPFGAEFDVYTGALPDTATDGSDSPFPPFLVSTPGYASDRDLLLMSASLKVAGAGDKPLPLPIATDLAGEVVWYYGKELDRTLACPEASATCTPGVTVVATTLGYGRLLLLAGDDQGHGGQYLREVDLAGNLIREFAIETIRVQLEPASDPQVRIGAFDHEAIRIANGQLVAQVSAEARVKTTLGATVWAVAGMPVALDPQGMVKWYWNPYSAYGNGLPKVTSNGPKCLADQPGCPPLFSTGMAYDWTHGNALAYSPADHQLIYSLRMQDLILKLDYDDGAGTTGILWRLGLGGEVAASGMQDDDDWFSHQHGVSYLSAEDPAAGRIILLDNGNRRCDPVGAADPCNSRGQTWLLDETDPAAASAALESNLDLGDYSSALGMAQQLGTDRYHFTLGMLCSSSDLGAPERCTEQTPVQSKVPYARSLELDAAGAPRYSQWFVGSLYRSYRLADLYGPGPSAAGGGGGAE